MTPKHRRGPRSRVLSDGTAFEQQVLDLLKLVPGAAVQTQVELFGKKVDIFCVLQRALIPRFRIAVECKDWTRPLARTTCAEILSDYYPLLDSRAIDQILIVTRRDIVPNAKKLFDGSRVTHITYAQLADQIFDPAPLISNMKSQYVSDGLGAYYVSQKAFAPNLKIATRHFERIYNEFMEFAIASPKYRTISGSGLPYDLKGTIDEWRKYASDGNIDWTKIYNTSSFNQAMIQRRDARPVNLERYFLDWLAEGSSGIGLALLASYGMGKSSFARRAAYICAERYAQDARSRIPLLIELKEFGSHQDIRGLITHELVNRHGVASGSFELFQSLNANGRFVLILDGFDEMKQGMTLDSLLFNFNQISMLCTSNSKILLCGRPTLFETQEEQNRVLKGEISMGRATAKYIQVTVAPFETPEVCKFLRYYGKAKYPSLAKRVETFVQTLEVLSRLGQWSEELRNLVSRPVHLPMIASYLEHHDIGPNDLTRYDLYDDFIDAIIEREMLKRRQEFQRAYSVAARRNFATELAVEMCKIGDLRSIRNSQIPDRLFEPFLEPGKSVDSVRRDLVAACFLERKAPDLLIIPHKSFAEFLVADYVVRLIRNDKTPRTDQLGFKFSAEIMSFIVEQLSREMWLKLADNAEANGRLILEWLRLAAQGKSSIPEQVLTTLCSVGERFPDAVRENIAYAIERRFKNVEQIPDAIAKWLSDSLGDPSFLVGTTVYRVLAARSALPPPMLIVSSIGYDRTIEWVRRNWIQLPSEAADVLQDYARSALIAALVRPRKQ
jgi:hypothetical protein